MIQADPHVSLLQETSEEKNQIFEAMTKKKKEDRKSPRYAYSITLSIFLFYRILKKFYKHVGLNLRYADDLVIFAHSRSTITQHFALVPNRISKNTFIYIPRYWYGKNRSLFSIKNSHVFRS